MGRSQVFLSTIGESLRIVGEYKQKQENPLGCCYSLEMMVV